MRRPNIPQTDSIQELAHVKLIQEWIAGRIEASSISGT